MSDEKSKSDKAKKRPYVYAFAEYPKKVTGPDGKRVKVNSKAEEGSLHAKKAPAAHSTAPKAPAIADEETSSEPPPAL